VWAATRFQKPGLNFYLITTVFDNIFLLSHEKNWNKKHLNYSKIHIHTCIQFTKGKRAEAEYRKARSHSIVWCSADQHPEQTISFVLTHPSLKGVRILNVSNETKFDTCMSRPFELTCPVAICWSSSWSLLMWSWWERASGSQRIVVEWKDNAASLGVLEGLVQDHLHVMTSQEGPRDPEA